MRITGDNEGKLQLDNFIDPESTYPVIATTCLAAHVTRGGRTNHKLIVSTRPSIR